MIDNTNQEIKHLLKQNQKFLLVSHIRPDGDAVGSLLGLGLSLIDAGKDVQMVLENGVPSSFKHLPGSDLVLNRTLVGGQCFLQLRCACLLFLIEEGFAWRNRFLKLRQLLLC